MSNIRGNQIKSTIVIPDGGRKNVDLTIYLLISGNTVSNLLTVYQVLTMKNVYSREILKGAVYQIIIIPYPANAGIRIKTGNNRICVSNFGCCISCHHPGIGIYLLRKRDIEKSNKATVERYNFTILYYVCYRSLVPG
jgi:hypothetical protein